MAVYFGRSKIKNETGKKIQKFTENKFSKIFIRIPGTYKKHLGHTDTSRSVQNNCTKLSGFGFDITRPFLHRGNNEKHSC